MRGILALGIVFLHFGFNGLSEKILGWGGVNFDLAVDIFFLLSGFVLAHSARNGVNRLNFASRRFWRLAPVFFATTLIAILASPRDVSPLELLMAVPLSGSQPINFPAWSIFWEFYLPVLAVFLPFRVPDAFVRPLLAVCLFGLGLTCVAVADGGRPDLLRASFGLSAGYLLYHANLDIRAPVLLTFGTIFGLMSLAVYVPMAAFFVPILASLAILSARYSKTILSSWPIQILGILSYTLYLTHIPVLMWMQRLLGAGFDGNVGAKAMGLIVTFFVSALLTWGLEKPFMQRAPTRAANAP